MQAWKGRLTRTCPGRGRVFQDGCSSSGAVWNHLGSSHNSGYVSRVTPPREHNRHICKFHVTYLLIEWWNFIIRTNLTFTTDTPPWWPNMLFGGPAATRRRLGGSAAARPWQRHASLDTRPSLIAIVTIPPMARPRQCCKRTLATNCVPGYGWQATMVLQDRLSKPEVRHYCYQRPLLCLSPTSIVFIAHYCVYRPLLCLSPTGWQVTQTAWNLTIPTTITDGFPVKFLTWNSNIWIFSYAIPHSCDVAKYFRVLLSLWGHRWLINRLWEW